MGIWGRINGIFIVLFDLILVGNVWKKYYEREFGKIDRHYDINGIIWKELYVRKVKHSKEQKIEKYVSKAIKKYKILQKIPNAKRIVDQLKLEYVTYINGSAMMHDRWKHKKEVRNFESTSVILKIVLNQENMMEYGEMKSVNVKLTSKFLFESINIKFSIPNINEHKQLNRNIKDTIMLIHITNNISCGVYIGHKMHHLEHFQVEYSPLNLI